MSEEMATRAVKVLVENFKRNFPKDGMKAIWSELVKQPEKAIEAAVNSICLNSSYLPAPAMLLEKVKTEAKMMAAKAAKEREEEWAKEKGGGSRKDMEHSGSIFTAEQQDAHGRHSLQAIRLMLGSASRKDKLECFKVMDQQYPGVGWAMEGMRLQKEWERLDKRPHWRDVSEASPQFQASYERQQA